MQTIAIIGGTGFVGTHIVSALAKQRYNVRVLTRRRERKRDLLVFPTLKLVETNLYDQTALTQALAGCDAVINLCGILNEQQSGGFERVHATLAQMVAEACQSNGIPRLLHMSALHAGADAPSEYLRSKGRGERAVMAWLDRGLGVTVFAPSVIFGLGDSFFNRFAGLLKMSPGGIFPLARAGARFAPVYAGDVAQAFLIALQDEDTVGNTYELCGPTRYSLRELIEYTASLTGSACRIVELGDRLGRAQAAILGRMPGQPFSTDNYLSLSVDSVCSENGLAALGIEQTTLESVVPSYLGEHHREGRNRRFRNTAGRSTVDP